MQVMVAELPEGKRISDPPNGILSDSDLLGSARGRSSMFKPTMEL